ncbi:MAG TPA: ABC transporter permease [Cyclobacteriaceae bacterium]
MLTNYLKTAYRNLLKNKSYSFINILGLSVGAAASMLIFLYVRYEYNYDTFFKDNDRIYRVVIERRYPDHVSHFALIPGGFSTIFADELPEIENSVRLVGFPNFASVIRQEEIINQEYYLFSADSNFFEIFDFKLLQGNPATALSKPGTVVTTQSTAKKYFAEEDPIGKFLEIDAGNFEVVGVMEDIPAQSHLKLDLLTSSENVGFLRDPSFYISGTYTYIKLRPGADPGAVEAKIPALVEKYAAGQIERNLGLSYKEYTDAGNGYIYTLQPVRDIHLHSNLGNEIKANGNITYVRMLLFISILILIIAGINFVNLATARSAERAKEVGIRKVMGSLRKQLIFQFLSESFLLSFVSLIVAIFIIQAFLSYFNNLTQRPLEFNFITGPETILILGITIFFGILAGIYPAFYISALKPVQVMSGKFKNSAKGNTLRKGLIIFQFTISIILISSSILMFNQFRFIQSKDLGFDKTNLMILNQNGTAGDADALKNELEKVPGVQSVATTNANPGGYFFGLQFRKPGDSEIYTTKGLPVDDHYISTMGIEVLEGRDFSPETNDSLNVILNESAVKTLGYEDPIGARLINSLDTVNRIYTIIGVVKDFNFESLRNEIIPMVIVNLEGEFGFFSQLSIRIAGESTNEIIPEVESIYKELNPQNPFIYTFLDETLDRQYSSEYTSGKMLGFFTIIAIVIACVGLFGLAAYSISQRTKEIGVRKVLGASVRSITLLIFGDFGRLIIAAFIIATPVSYYAMDRWLESFAYKTSLNLWVFLLAGILVLFITTITISYQSISAATVNPAKSLKSE